MSPSQFGKNCHKNPMKPILLGDTLVLAKTGKFGKRIWVTSLGPEDTRRPFSRRTIEQIMARDARDAAKIARSNAKNFGK